MYVPYLAQITYGRPWEYVLTITLLYRNVSSGQNDRRQELLD